MVEGENLYESLPTVCFHPLNPPWPRNRWKHQFATSFGTTHGVAHASCKFMPLRHVNTDVFVSTLRVVRAREHEW